MDKVNRIVSMLLSLIFGVMVLVIFFQVLIRFVFPYLGIQLNFPWTEELARYLMIWSVFLGGALATRRGQLLAVDAIVFALPSLPGRIVKFSFYRNRVCPVWCFNYRSEEHTSELQSRGHLVCRLLLVKKNRHA